MKKNIFLVILVSLIFFQKNYSEEMASKTENWSDLIMHYQSFCVYEAEWFTCTSKDMIIDVINNIQPLKLMAMINKSRLDIFELLYVLNTDDADWRIIEMLEKRGYQFDQNLFGCNAYDAAKIIGDEILINVLNNIKFNETSFNCDQERMKKYYR